MNEGGPNEMENVNQMMLYWWKHRHLIPQNRCGSGSWILPLTIRLTKIFVEVFVHCSDQHR